MMDVLDKVTGTQQELAISGSVPIVANYVKLKPENRHGWNTTRHAFNDDDAKLIPFVFNIELPAPDWRTTPRTRVRVSRNIDTLLFL